MKTYGAMLNDLNERFLAATSDLVMGRPEFIHKRALRIHRAFDAFCRDCEIDPPQRGAVRTLLRTHFTQYRSPWSTRLEDFFEWAPQEFMVRGKWVSEDVKI